VGETRLGDKTVALVVKRAAEAAGIDPTQSAGHSLRTGLATAAAAMRGCDPIRSSFRRWSLATQPFADLGRGMLRANVYRWLSLSHDTNGVIKVGIVFYREPCLVSLAMDHHPFQFRPPLLRKGICGYA